MRSADLPADMPQELCHSDRTKISNEALSSVDGGIMSKTRDHAEDIDHELDITSREVADKFVETVSEPTGPDDCGNTRFRRRMTCFFTH